MSSKTNKYLELMPELIQESNSDIKYKWIEWYKLGETIKNHPLRFYPIEYKGEIIYIDCTGVVGMGVKRAKKYKGTQEDIDEIRRRSRIIQELQTEKGILNRNIFNKEYKERLRIREADVLRNKQSKILEMFGRYMGLKEVFSYIKREWGINTTLAQLKEFYETNKPKIEQLRSEYVLRNREFNIATETGRMETLSMLHQHWVSKFEMNPSVAISKEIGNILEQVRKEVKGDEIKLTIDGKIDIQATQQANVIIDDVLHKLPLMQMILGMVSAKRGINPTLLMQQLTSSFYSKYNGFKQLSEDAEPNPAAYIKNYDFSRLEQLCNDNPLNIEDVEFEQVQEVKPELKETVKDKRDLLLEKFNKTKSLSE